MRGMAAAMAMVMVMLMALPAGAVKEFTSIWNRGTESAYAVQLAKQGNAWNNANNSVGEWTGGVYLFRLDMSSNASYDPSSYYRIWENAVVVVDSLALTGGTILIIDTLRAHSALTAAHGATGAVVGTTNSQTLTNKTIDGDVNTVLDLPGATALKSGTNLRVSSIEPTGGTNTALMMSATSSVLTLNARDTTEVGDRSLVIDARAIALQDSSGGRIVVTGVKLSTTTSSAVPREHVDSLATRIDALEIDNTWGSSPGVTLTTSVRRKTVTVNFWTTNHANMDSIKRWEVFWSYDGLSVSAGATSSDELDYLRGAGNRVILRAGEGHVITLTPVATIDVVAVGFDWAETPYNSDVSRVTIEGGNFALSATGEVIEAVGGLSGQATIASTAIADSAAELVEWQATGVTFIRKFRQPYLHDATISRLRATFYSRSAMAGFVGFVKMAVMNGASEVASATFVTPYAAAMPSTPQTLDLDPTSALTAGKLYQIYISIAGDVSGTNVKMSSDVQVQVIRAMTVY